MNVHNDIEEKLRKIRCSTPSQADEHILSDAMSEFERASKVQLGRSRRTITAVVVVVIILIAAVIILLMRQGETEQERPKITERQTVTEQPAKVEKPEQPEIQPQPKVPRMTQKDKPVRKKPPADDTQSKLERISSFAAAGDVDSLAAILKTGALQDKIVAVQYLSRMSDERAEAVLDELAEQLDPDEPEDYFLAEALGIEDFGIPEEQTEEIEQTKAQTATEPNKPAAEKQRPPKQYITGWLSDVDGYDVEGTIQVGQKQATTDPNGAFSIERPSFAQFTSYIGYAASTDSNMGLIFHWYQDDDFNNIEIICMPFASASGSVTDVNSQPVNDVQIKIVPDVNKQLVHVPGDLKGPWQIKIEADGSFEITSILTGYPLVLVMSKDDSGRRMPLDEPAPGEHLNLGKIVLEAVLKEDSIPDGG